MCQVLEDGSYERPEMDKLQYASMINIRAGLPSMAANSLGMGCTIAIRYSCVRRQSEIKPGFVLRDFAKIYCACVLVFFIK